MIISHSFATSGLSALRQPTSSRDRFSGGLANQFRPRAGLFPGDLIELLQQFAVEGDVYGTGFHGLHLAITRRCIQGLYTTNGPRVSPSQPAITGLVRPPGIVGQVGDPDLRSACALSRAAKWRRLHRRVGLCVGERLPGRPSENGCSVDRPRWNTSGDRSHASHRRVDRSVPCTRRDAGRHAGGACRSR